MKINELVEKYNKNNRIDIAKEVESQPYIGIMQKRRLAELVLDSCTSEIDGKLYIDSVERYILFTIAIIESHTNLEFDYEDGNVVDDYDQLCQHGLLVKIIDTFSDDYASCQEVLNMVTSDKAQENMTIEQIVYRFLDNAQSSLKSVIDTLAGQIDLDALKELPINSENLSVLRDFIDNK